MNADNGDFKYKELTELAIKCFYIVYNALGYGFLEKVYVNALKIEFEKLHIQAKAQHPIQVFYDGTVIGEYFCDILLQEHVIIEVKAARSITLEHEAQLLNYLKASSIEVGLLLNFGSKPQFKRIAFDNVRKQ